MTIHPEQFGQILKCLELIQAQLDTKDQKLREKAKKHFEAIMAELWIYYEAKLDPY